MDLITNGSYLSSGHLWREIISRMPHFARHVTIGYSNTVRVAATCPTQSFDMSPPWQATTITIENGTDPSKDMETLYSIIPPFIFGGRPHASSSTPSPTVPDDVSTKAPPDGHPMVTRSKKGSLRSHQVLNLSSTPKFHPSLERRLKPCMIRTWSPQSTLIWSPFFLVALEKFFHVLPVLSFLCAICFIVLSLSTEVNLDDTKSKETSSKEHWLNRVSKDMNPKEI